MTTTTKETKVIDEKDQETKGADKNDKAGFDLNEVFLTGNLTKAPYKFEISGEKEKVSITVASKQGNKTNFIPVTLWNGKAKMAMDYLTKGKLVTVKAHIVTSSYEKDGETIYTTEFVADNLSF